MPVGALNIAGRHGRPRRRRQARELGAEPVVYERDACRRIDAALERLRLALSTWEVFREQCPGGDPILQRLILERFDDALDWLEAQGGRCSRAKPGIRSRSAPGSTRGSWSTRLRRTSVSARRRMIRRSSPPAASPFASPVRRACCCARTDGAKATVSTSRLRGAQRRRATSTSSTGARWRRWRRSRKLTSYAWASSTESSRRSRRRTAPSLRRRAELVGDRRRTAGRAVAGRPRLVHGRTIRARGTRSRPDGG